jgi:protein-tyrosine phosphatase
MVNIITLKKDNSKKGDETLIDFHSHILPGIDDGSENLQMSSNMIDISVDEGVEHICATPHFIFQECEIDREAYERRIDELKDSCREKDVNILTGLELFIHPDLPSLYKDKKIWGINDTRYLLIELPMQEYPIYTEKLFYQLRLEGAIPIIAHPERNLKIGNNIELLVRLVEQGTLVQMNAGSLRGIYGKLIQKNAEKLLSMNLVHVLGSDGHNDARRPTKLVEGYNRVKDMNKELHEWITENESLIIQGGYVELPEIRVVRKKKSVFDFFRRRR